MSSDMISIFYAQSYADTWNDYLRAVADSNIARWHYVILTASNEQQAEAFREQLIEREKVGFLPKGTHFAVIPDPEGKRVGSGGATLNVLRYIAAVEGKADFSGLRILCIHSGGDSKRIPQYSALGKLFSPVPHELPNGRTSTLFDELMIVMSSVSTRIREGMMMLSGDVMLLFNPLQINYSGHGAAAISFKESVELGKDHGVYLSGPKGNVLQCLQKKSIEYLAKAGAINDQGCVDIDTGAVIFSADMLKDLYGLVCSDGELDLKKWSEFVNDHVRLSLYADFLYPLAEESTLEKFFAETPEGEFSEELLSVRRQVWNVLRQYRIKIMRMAPAKFLHFGTTRQIMELLSDEIENYAYLGWKRCVCSTLTHDDVAAYNSVLSTRAVCGKGTYLESSYVHRDGIIGENTLLSYVDIHDEKIPDNVVLHGLKLRGGRFVVRIYGVDDNPKAGIRNDGTFLGIKLDEWMKLNGIAEAELWNDDDTSLWAANIYPVSQDIRSAVAAALNIYEMSRGKGDVAAWRRAERTSMKKGFSDADTSALLAWDRRMHEYVTMESLAHKMSMCVPANEVDIKLDRGGLSKVQKEWLQKRLETSDFSEKIRLYYYIGKAMGGASGERYVAEAFKIIRDLISGSTVFDFHSYEDIKIVEDRFSVQLPLRVNWGGGWSDTPPYCIENGGTVLNAAVLLNGKKPVEVTLVRINDLKVVFDSRDMDVHGEFCDIEQLQSVGDPYDSFVLQKAALLACGILPENGGDLESVLRRLGGGFEMHTEVNDVPKGSGLGTSSILAAACVKAVMGFIGKSIDDSEVYRRVLIMEQIMSTGGGWQDQVGGVASGIKFIRSEPGVEQNLSVENVRISDQTRRELSERYCLIYTGQRRLARHLLRDVVGRYIGNNPDTVEALNEIQRIAVLMKFELERGRVDDFAHLLTEHWELSKKIDSGCTNTLIDQIFQSIDDITEGRMICGAGGGGFLQVVLKKGATAGDLRSRIKAVFQDSEIDVWNCSIM